MIKAKGSTLRTLKIVLEGYKDEPLELPKLFAKKFATFFNSFEVPDNANFYFFRDRLLVLRPLPVFACLLGAGSVGLIAALTRGVLRKDEFLLAVVGILTPLAACLLVQTTSRYRAAVAGPLALGSGLFLFLLLEEIRRRRMRAAWILAGSAGLLSLIPFLPSTIYDARHRYADREGREVGFAVQGVGEKLVILPARHLSRPEGLQVLSDELGIEQAETTGPQPRDEMHQRDLGGIAGAVEHALAEEGAVRCRRACDKGCGCAR